MIQPLASLSLNERVKKTLTHQVTMIIIPFYFIFIPECNGGTEFGDISCRQREREREGQRSEGERGGARSTGDRWRVVVGGYLGVVVGGWGWRRYAHVWLLASAFPGKKKG